MSDARNCRAQLSLAASRYEEDVVPPGHSSVWGSFFSSQDGWGYACCRATDKNAPACCESERPALPESKRADQAPNEKVTKSWMPRSSFQTSVGFLAHALQYLLQCWRSAGTKSPEFVPRGDRMPSQKAMDEVDTAIRDLSDKLGAQKLPLVLLLKLEEMVTCIGEKEYTSANKIYMDLVIGSKKWLNDMPYMVNFSMARQDTEVHWAPQSSTDPVEEAGVREHIVHVSAWEAGLRLMLLLEQGVPTPFHIVHSPGSFDFSGGPSTLDDGLAGVGPERGSVQELRMSWLVTSVPDVRGDVPNELKTVQQVVSTKMDNEDNTPEC
ncbi:unnamed protein product [Durusdinium trenchii]|uniref:Pre-mRNA-splicing factor SLU7 n=1 Tax=Durusdinium trenchii TaxID=1381693 RepID=A0ABP0HQX9_9DINO